MGHVSKELSGLNMLYIERKITLSTLYLRKAPSLRTSTQLKVTKADIIC